MYVNYDNSLFSLLAIPLVVFIVSCKWIIMVSYNNKNTDKKVGVTKYLSTQTREPEMG